VLLLLLLLLALALALALALTLALALALLLTSFTGTAGGTFVGICGGATDARSFIGIVGTGGPGAAGRLDDG
tara:strand:- start:5 stop:220 length:216 start_codon:yes stop_codon:yes gene_type:complete